jgi:hypothetical protein
MSRLAALLGITAAASSFGAGIPAPTTADLAMRDPARAAAFGLFGKGEASHFDGTFGGERSGAFSFGDDSMGFGFGAQGSFTEDVHGLGKFGATVRGGHSSFQDMMKARNIDQHMIQAAERRRWQEMEQREQQKAAHRRSRELLLDPNGDSDLKVERYAFPISQTIPALGTPYIFINYFGQPDTKIRPERVLMNAPGAGFVLITDIKTANVSGLVGGGGATDASFFAPGAFNVHLSLPTLTPANKLSIQGSYTGYVPPGYPVMPYQFVTQVNGPATVAGSD